MSVIFTLTEESSRKLIFFIFLKCCYFVIGCPIDMNFGVFWEVSVAKKGWFAAFLKIELNLSQYECQRQAKIQLPWESRRVVLVLSI